MGTYNNYNLIAMNNCMGKAVTNGGGTGNSVYGNRYDSGDYKDFTGDEKNKLASIEAGANNYTHPDSHPASMITDFPTSMTPTAHDQAGTTITVADSGGYFTGTNAETVLQEIGSTLNGLEAAITAITG